MRLIFLFLSLLSLATLIHALLPVSAFRRAYRRLGVDSSNIPDSAIAKLSRDLEHAHSEAEARQVHNQFVTSLRRQNKGGGISGFINTLWTISRVLYYIGKVIYGSGELVNSVNKPIKQFNYLWNNLYQSQYGYNYGYGYNYRREVQRFDGDFEQIHHHLVKTILREAAKHLPRKQYLELKHQLRERDIREHAQLQEAFELTRKAGPKRRLHRKKTRNSGEI